MKTARRLFAALGLVTVIVTVAVVGLTGLPASHAAPAIEIHKVDDAAFDPSPTEPFFVLVLGNDGRAGLAGQRGDAIHVVGVNPAAKVISILDIPRDTYVGIPGHGSDKINSAFQAGGLQLEMQAIAGLTGVHFSWAATTDFDGFQHLVDDVGGVDIQVPYRMFDRYSGADFQPGMVHMAGGAALSYARNRHDTPNGDISRTENQGWLLIAGLVKAQSDAKTPVDAVRLTGDLIRNVRFDGTSLPDLYRLIRFCLTFDAAKVRNVVMPSRIGSVGAASVVFPAAGSQELFADFRDDAILQSH